MEMVAWLKVLGSAFFALIFWKRLWKCGIISFLNLGRIQQQNSGPGALFLESY